MPFHFGALILLTSAAARVDGELRFVEFVIFSRTKNDGRDRSSWVELAQDRSR